MTTSIYIWIPRKESLLVRIHPYGPFHLIQKHPKDCNTNKYQRYVSFNFYIFTIVKKNMRDGVMKKCLSYYYLLVTGYGFCRDRSSRRTHIELSFVNSYSWRSSSCGKDSNCISKLRLKSNNFSFFFLIYIWM